MTLAALGMIFVMLGSVLIFPFFYRVLTHKRMLSSVVLFAVVGFGLLALVNFCVILGSDTAWLRWFNGFIMVVNLFNVAMFTRIYCETKEKELEKTETPRE